MRWKQITQFLSFLVEGGSSGWRVYQAASFIAVVFPPVQALRPVMSATFAYWALIPFGIYVMAALTRKVWVLERFPSRFTHIQRV